MDLTFLNEFSVPVIVGICLCVGYIIKHFIPTDNCYIPLIMGVLGVALSFWINRPLTAETLLCGLFSGLASTGLHQAFKQMIGDGGK